METDAHIGVVSAIDGDKAVIRFVRSSMCAHCGACMTSGDAEMETRLPNKLHATVGDRVEVAMSGRRILWASVIGYVLPLAALLVGLFLGSLVSDLVSVAAGLVLCTASFPLIRLLDRRYGRMRTFEPSMIKIIRQEEENDGK